MRTTSTWGGVALLTLVILLGPALADDAPPAGGPGKAAADGAARERIAEGLARERDFAEVGRRARKLDQELREALAADADWVQAALLLVELGDLRDRRAVASLVAGLCDRRPLVAAFALHGLARLGPDDLRKGGGAPLVEALLDPLKGRHAWSRVAARSLLARVVGEDLGSTTEKWRAWLRKHAAELVVEPPPPPFLEAEHDAALVAEVRAAAVSSGTSVRPRIPSIATELRELNSNGLDVAICLDQTGSMGAVLAEAKARVTTLTDVVGLVVKDARFGLVTFDDGLKVFEPLRKDGAGLREVLERIKAEGGGDTPEGVDKALEGTVRGEFGWRRRAAKSIVVIGDAPPHDGDVARTLELVASLREKLGAVTNTVSTGGVTEPTLARIAERGGGRALLLAEPARLVGEILLLIFGEPLRPAMERFVPVLLEVQTDPAPEGRPGR